MFDMVGVFDDLNFLENEQSDSPNMVWADVLDHCWIYRDTVMSEQWRMLFYSWRVVKSYYTSYF